MDDRRERAREIQVNDRISELPNSLIDCILGHLPIGDVVRTSILSRKWRHHWTRVGNLVFDDKFAEEEIVKKISKEPLIPSDNGLLSSAYIDAVCSLLLLHDGPINIFSMRLPRFKFGHTIDGTLCKWVRALSLRGVKVFTLDTFNVPPVALPSYIFDCQEMRQLALRNCKVSFPPNVRGFKNLTSLQLDFVCISENVLNTLISNCPLLEKLFLQWIYGYRDLSSVSVCALNLRTLEVEGADITALSLQNVPNLATLTVKDLQLKGVDEHTFTSFFGAMPKVTYLTIGGQTLKGWTTHGFPKMLPMPLDNLNILSIVALNQAEPKQMYGILCILRSSPYLQRLNLSISRHSDNEIAEAAAVAFLRKRFGKPKYFPSSLSTVTIKWLMGSQPQILLLKFILTSCPSLEMLNLNADAAINQEAELQMMAELLDCHRASSKVKITYIKGEGESAKRYTTGNVDTSVFEF